MMRHFLLLAGVLIVEIPAHASDVPGLFAIGRVKYAGGGDWYNDPSAEVNLLKYVREQVQIDVDPAYHPVDISSEEIFSYPFLFLTGHGNISFSDAEVRRLRTYLENGGFLYADDDYGMDKSLRREMEKIFPGRQFAELPLTHGIYSSQFVFSDGPPKTHEHDGKPAQGFGLFHNGRLVVFYTYESNPSDGWADPEVHGNSPEKREEALRFGCNVVVWALTH
jgi:hypothetical protein